MMETNNLNSDEPAPPGTSPPLTPTTSTVVNPDTPRPPLSSKGVENAKKRLRAFSILKKTTLSPIIPKPVNTGNTTVLIGKLASVKTTPKVEDDQKKPPKPPKPGSTKRCFQDSYTHQQKRTIGDIEDMKRKMELVDLGIPLGLICPTSTSEKAMPTKAMPPIKSFLGERIRVVETSQHHLTSIRLSKKSIARKHLLTNAYNPAKVDELIREAKKARFEGREFKFDYQKLLPDYDNPFQRKKDDDKDHKSVRRKGDLDKRGKDSRKTIKRHSDYRDKYKDKDKSKDRFVQRNKEEKKETRNDAEKTAERETNVNLKDFLVCDSWSLENDDKTNSPKSEDKAVILKTPDKKDVESKVQDNVTEKDFPQPIQENRPKKQLKEILPKKIDVRIEGINDTPSEKPPIIEKLKPVMDSFKFEIDPNDDEILDIFDEDCNIEKYSKVKSTKAPSRISPVKDLVPCEQETSKDVSMDGMNDDTFLESVINEIRQDDNMCDETSQDKRLVEYDESPIKDDYDSPAHVDSKAKNRISVTPELDEKMKEQTKIKTDNDKKEKSKSTSSSSERKRRSSQRSDYSDGRRSSESGYKTSDTNETSSKYDYRLSIEKELDDSLAKKMDASTMESLETWSFVLKICQPLLFRHDKNKCYRETRITPKIWYTENPKICTCVKDRAIVYDELEMLKMGLVDNLYGCDQIADTPFINARAWYPRAPACLAESRVQPAASEWEGEGDEAQHDVGKDERKRRSVTPQRNEEIMLDREYQRFMEAVWPDVAEAKVADTSRSTTPVQQQESRRKKKEEDTEKEAEDRKAKKMKLSSEGWSQESDVEEEVEKRKKLKMTKEKEKTRKRKRSTSTLSSISDSDASAKKKRKLDKKKAQKKAKSKEAKRRRIGKKLLKKLKEKQKQKKKADKVESDDLELEHEKKSELKKTKKKKAQKLKKKNQKRKKKESSSSSTDSSSSTSSSSSSYSSSSDSDSESDRSKKRKAEAKRKRQKRKKSSERGENLFDVNILNNIKTERLTDDEKGQKLLEFSPRAHSHSAGDSHKPREIINVKELQNDFVGNNNIQIKKEAEEVAKPQEEKKVEEEKTETVVDREDIKRFDSFDILPPLPVGPPPALPVVPIITTPIAAVPLPATPIPPTTVVTTPTVTAAVTTTPVVATAQEEIQPTRVLDESNMSQSSSQESVCSVKETPVYEKDESHLRPSSHNSNYSFNDVIASQNELYQKGVTAPPESQDKYAEGYEHETDGYEMYEQLAMAYQSDVATQVCGGEGGEGAAGRRIETVVRTRARGEIKCDWRADRAAAAPPATRPSRWGLAPSDVNIVLTGGEQSPHPGSPQPVYRIQSLANRTDVSADYDEAYMDMYGASDRLQYGDCFATDAGPALPAGPDAAPPGGSPRAAPDTRSTLDARIDRALRETVLGEVAKEAEVAEEQMDLPEKGILITSTSASDPARGVKRVSFADGYKPGQDSDVEDPPVKKRRRWRRAGGARRGCAWPCPASHPDHVPLWDALPPPPPPPGSPPRSCRRAMQDSGKPLGGFMPPEPPPGLISF